jgi:hypothetical protein
MTFMGNLRDSNPELNFYQGKKCVDGITTRSSADGIEVDLPMPVCLRLSYIEEWQVRQVSSPTYSSPDRVFTLCCDAITGIEPVCEVCAIACWLLNMVAGF